jgi:hypothetical protein
LQGRQYLLLDKTQARPPKVGVGSADERVELETAVRTKPAGQVEALPGRDDGI